VNVSFQQFYLWLANHFQVPANIVEQWVWGGIVLGFIFATVHLITMLVTRWGDHHASSKSLLFSLLVHLGSGVGVIALAPEPVREKVVRDLEPIRIHDVQIAGVRQTRTDEAGNTPIWESVPLTETNPLSRMEREQFRPTPSSIPERNLEEPINLSAVMPEPDQIKPAPVEQPELAMATPAPQNREIAAIPEIESPEMPALPVPTPNGTDPEVPERSRSQLPRSMTLSEDVQRPSPGGSDSISPQFKDQVQLRSPDIERGPRPELPNKGIVSETVERRKTPEQATSENLIAGEMTPNGEGSSQPNSSENRVVTRSPRVGNAPANEMNTPTRNSGPVPETKFEPSLAMSIPMKQGSDEIPRMTGFPAPNFDAVRRDQSAEIPATYRLRDLERRKDIARKYGGTDASEEAVERALTWLVSTQEPAGFWDGSKQGSGQIEIDEAGIDRQKAGINADTGLTALTILAFLGAGYTQEEGKYTGAVTKAINWLIDQQREDGYLGGNATRYAGMYCHGMATYALAEAYGMRSDRTINDKLSQAVLKGVQFTVGMQNKEDGGWRYLPDWSGDMSMFGWHMMALKSAEIAGINIPQESRTLMVKFLTDRSLGDRKGLAAYHPEYGPEVTAAMTAEGLFCKQMMGIRRSNPASQEAAQYLLAETNAPKASTPNLYYWYYGTLAMYQFGGEEWNQWNGQVRELLIAKQRKQGPLAGSWNPDGPWGGYGGRIYSTALATLSLEVYYRFLPLYRINDQ